MKNFRDKISDYDLIEAFSLQSKGLATSESSLTKKAFTGGIRSLITPDEAEEGASEDTGETSEWQEVLTLLDNPKMVASYHSTWLGILEKSEESLKGIMAGDLKNWKDWGIVGTTIFILFKSTLFQFYTDLEIVVKNIKEAFDNYEKIVEQLPLSKYELEVGDVYDPTKIKEVLKQKIQEHRDSPEDLYEIVTIIHVASHFWSDGFSVIVNIWFLFVDVLQLLVGMLDGPLPIMNLVAGIFGQGIKKISAWIAQKVFSNLFFHGFNFSIFGGDIARSYAQSSFWGELKDEVRTICEENLESKEVETDEQTSVEESAETISSRQLGNLQKNLGLLGGLLDEKPL